MSQPSRSLSDPLAPALLSALRAQLLPGERLAWAASPELAAFETEARPSGKWDAAIIVGGGYATLGACVMAARTQHVLWLSVPISLLMLGAVRYLILSRTKARARRAVAGTVYGMTTRRALIVHTYPALVVQDLPLETLTGVSVVNKRDYYSDLSLERAPDSAALVFRGVVEPERARTQISRVIRDPQVAEQELAASEAYALAMRRLVVGPMSS